MSFNSFNVSWSFSEYFSSAPSLLTLPFTPVAVSVKNINKAQKTTPALATIAYTCQCLIMCLTTFLVFSTISFVFCTVSFVLLTTLPGALLLTASLALFLIPLPALFAKSLGVLGLLSHFFFKSSFFL